MAQVFWIYNTNDRTWVLAGAFPSSAAATAHVARLAKQETRSGKPVAPVTEVIAVTSS
jgi:hypothetical protein